MKKKKTNFPSKINDDVKSFSENVYTEKKSLSYPTWDLSMKLEKKSKTKFLQAFFNLKSY